MPILARFTNFYDFHDFREAVANAILRNSEIRTVNFEIHIFLFICAKKLLFYNDTILCPGKFRSFPSCFFGLKQFVRD